MYPATFDYHRAASLGEALDLLAAHPEAKALAGGHSLIPLLKLRLAQPAALVDIGRLGELSGVRRTDAGTVRVGALTRHAEIAASEVLHADCPLLAEAAGKIGDPQVRSRGTIGGNIAHADPASDLPGVLVALGATVHLVAAAGERRVAAKDFFVDLLSTDLRPGELIAAVEVPSLPPGTGSCYLKVEHPASGYAVCGAAAWLGFADGAVSGGGLAFNGVAPTPVDGRAVVAALAGGPADDAALAAAVGDHLAVENPLGDLHASGEYRVELARTYGRRALAKARERAGG
jgi:carbon-monoxide dehydrogenase medium subunit